MKCLLAVRAYPIISYALLLGNIKHRMKCLCQTLNLLRRISKDPHQSKMVECELNFLQPKSIPIEFDLFGYWSIGIWFICYWPFESIFLFDRRKSFILFTYSKRFWRCLSHHLSPHVCLSSQCLENFDGIQMYLTCKQKYFPKSNLWSKRLILWLFLPNFHWIWIFIGCHLHRNEIKHRSTPTIHQSSCMEKWSKKKKYWE